MAFSTRWKNWKLKLDRHRLERQYSEISKKARKQKNEALLDEWWGTTGYEIDIIEARIKENISREVIDEAARLYLPTPSAGDSEQWEPREDLPPVYHWMILTPKAMTELRASIRQEKASRREVWETRLKIAGTFVAALTGIGGTIIGIIAVSNKGR